MARYGEIWEHRDPIVQQVERVHLVRVRVRVRVRARVRVWGLGLEVEREYHRGEGVALLGRLHDEPGR